MEQPVSLEKWLRAQFRFPLQPRGRGHGDRGPGAGPGSFPGAAGTECPHNRGSSEKPAPGKTLNSTRSGGHDPPHRTAARQGQSRRVPPDPIPHDSAGRGGGAAPQDPVTTPGGTGSPAGPRLRAGKRSLKRGLKRGPKRGPKRGLNRARARPRPPRPLTAPPLPPRPPRSDDAMPCAPAQSAQEPRGGHLP